MWCLAARPGENEKNNACSWYLKKDAVGKEEDKGDFIRKSDSTTDQPCMTENDLDKCFVGWCDPSYWSCPQRESGFGDDAYPPPIASGEPIPVNWITE
jgi:hypothetical protein